MNLKNIERDAFWVQSLLAADRVNWTTTAFNVASSGSVNNEIASVQSGNTSGSGGVGVGVLMASNDEERCPYRVKAYVPTDDNVFLIVGYAPASPTGDDATAEHMLFHLIGEMDEIIMLPYNATYKDRAILFGIYTTVAGVKDVSLSVQKLDVSPPQFARAVP